MFKKKQKRVGILIKNSSNGTLHTVHGEGPDGGIDIEDSRNLDITNMTGKATGEIPDNNRQVWYKDFPYQVLIGLTVIVLAWGISIIFSKDSYVGFYYPDVNNLANDIQSKGGFSSLEACRDWVNEQITIYNPDGLGYDYECGKNCDLSGGKPYVCEETLE